MSKKQPLNNAGKIIERFGGIRPMAAKIDTPVTTVQGWKKRDVIPGTRRAQIMSAASDNNIDISDLAEAVISNENKATQTSKTKPESKAVSKTVSKTSATNTNEKTNEVSEKHSLQENTDADKSSLEGDSTSVPEVEVKAAHQVKAPHKSVHSPAMHQSSEELNIQDHEVLMSQIQMNNEKAMKSSAWISTGLILTALSVGMLLFWPQFKESKRKLEDQKQQLAVLEKQLSEAKANNQDSKEFLKAKIPENLQEKMDQIQNQARNISNTVEQLSKKAKEISAQKMENGTQAIAARLDEIETQIKDGVPNVKAPNLEGVPTQEIKAAAILVAFSQFRNSLEREAPFEDDLALLQKLIGDDNPELQEKLNQLSEHADEGVLTPSGLASELKKMTGDIVVSSLKGEDVSIKEKARARFGSILQVEKEGEIISGTETQATVSRAQEYVENGKIEDSIVTLEGLDDEPAKVAQPFIEKAKASLLAQQVKKMISSDVLLGKKIETPDLSMDALPQGVEGIKKAIEENVPMLGDKKVIKDEESGLTILPKSSTGFKGLLDGQN